MKTNKSKLSKLEKEFEKKIEDHVKPDHKTWTPYKKFISDLKKTKMKKENPQIVDKLTRQLNKDLEKAQKEEQKRLLKEIKKLSKELGMKKEFDELKKANQSRTPSTTLQFVLPAYSLTLTTFSFSFLFWIIVID